MTITNEPKAGRRFIPPVILLNKSSITECKNDVKLLKNNNGEYMLMISPLFKTILDKTTRGRTTKQGKITDLERIIQDKIPTDIKGLIKKNNRKSKLTGMFEITVDIINVTDEIIKIKNPYLKK